jgi:hypothetical protein
LTKKWFELNYLWAIFPQTKHLGFFPQYKLCNNFEKMVLGYALGDFFTNSSGHPGELNMLVAKIRFWSQFEWKRSDEISVHATASPTGDWRRCKITRKNKIGNENLIFF